MATEPKNPDKPQNWRPRTKLTHGGIRRSQFGELSEAIFLTQAFAYPSAEAAEARFKGEDPGFIYARYGNPTVAMFEDRLAGLEGAEACFATASGMAAVSAALLCQVQAGDKVVASKALFGSCLYILETLLPRYGVETVFVDGHDLDAWRDAFKGGARAAFVETPANPTLDLVDIKAVAALAHEVGAVLIVDNAFASPIFQHPLELGADIVVYSATKHIDGQGRVLGGAVLGSQSFIHETLETYVKHTGGALSPFSAWLLLKSMETLDLRVRAQAANAARLAEALAGHPKLTKLIYPGRDDHPHRAVAKAQMEGGGTMLAVEVGGGQAGAFRAMNALQVFTISNNLGDAKSIATHPATTTHQRLGPEKQAALGVSPGLLRLSAGLEDPEDLVEDFLTALEAV